MLLSVILMWKQDTNNRKIILDDGDRHQATTALSIVKWAPIRIQLHTITNILPRHLDNSILLRLTLM